MKKKFQRCLVLYYKKNAVLFIIVLIIVGLYFWYRKRSEEVRKPVLWDKVDNRLLPDEHPRKIKPLQ